MRGSINRPPTPDGEELPQKEPSLREIINIKLIESGEKEKLMELLRQRLIECGWRDDMKSLCRAYAKKKGRNNVTVDDLIHVITPKGRGGNEPNFGLRPWIITKINTAHIGEHLPVHTNGISSVVWLPPEAGDAIACVCVDGTFSIWEEVGEDNQTIAWKRCFQLESTNCRLLDVKFRAVSESLKMITAYSDGHVKIFELSDQLDLDRWQLQSDFLNVVDSVSRFGNSNCFSASIAWKPREAQLQRAPASFVLGFNSESPQLNSSKIWEFDEAHHRWILVGELALPEDKGDAVNSVAWAPNIGRPYEIIAVASFKGIAIWHVGLNPGPDGRLSTKKVALLSGHDGEVWQLDWDMSGMTLASTGDDGMVRLWQCNLDGVWHEQAAVDCGTVQA